MEHKNIDRLFQEKLKDMEVTPDPKIWNAIEQKLQKKKRRVLPIWWIYGGTVACLILGLFMFSNLFEEEQIKDKFPVITEEIIKENENLKKVKIEEGIIKEKNEVDNNEGIKITEKSSIEENNFKSIATRKQKTAKESIVKGAFFTDKIVENEKNNNSGKDNIVKEVFPSNEIVNNEKSNNSREDTVRDAFFADKIVENEKGNNSGKDMVKEVFPSNEIAKNGKGNNSGEDAVKGVSSSEIIAKTTDLLKKKETDKKDFIAEVSKQKELEKNENVTTEKKWSVSPMVGFLKSDSFSQASALEGNLNDNNFSGENSVSYGVGVSYQLNDKWTLKTGIQLQTNSFTTNDVALSGSASTNASILENVDFEVSNDIANQDSPELDGFVSNNDFENGSLQQTYGYIEIPMELKFTFLSFQKIKTSVISGVSSLILNENNIIGETNRFSNEGSASNLSSLNFSGNLGLDFDLELSEKLNFNINPMLKTQLNTFNSNSNGFQPYNIGVYTGIRYKF